jgi:hypothetical protein
MNQTQGVINAVSALFVAFGAHRDTDRAQLYVDEITKAVRCGPCVELAVGNLMRSAPRLPTIAQVCAEGRDVLASDDHGRHVSFPQLAPRVETWWRTQAPLIIDGAAKCGPDLALFIAAQMWWVRIPPDDEEVAREATAPVWVNGAQAFLEGRDVRALTTAAFARARWAAEHGRDEGVPAAVLDLEVTV